MSWDERGLLREGLCIGVGWDARRCCDEVNHQMRKKTTKRKQGHQSTLYKDKEIRVIE